MRSYSPPLIGAVTSSAMTISTFPIVVASVLASQFIADFDISRAQVGFLITATGLVGAIVALPVGRLTDRIGAVSATRWVLVLGMVTLVAMALSPTYAVLVVAALATGVPNGWCNPATNTLIADNLAAGQRGLVTGVKQSGVQFGVFLGGLLLPALTALWNWRAAVLWFLLIPAAGLVGMVGRHSATHTDMGTEASDVSMPKAVRWIAVYGFLSGTAVSAASGFLPLFAEEDQLLSAQAAGALFAVVGIMGIFARILWPRLSEARLGHGRTLRIVASLSTLSSLLLAMAALNLVETWVLIPAALLLGTGAVAWNAVGMLAVMDLSPQGSVGKGTGIVLLGFLLGLATGAPLMGLSVDWLGSYQAGWLGTAVLLAICVVIAGRIPAGSTLART